MTYFSFRDRLAFRADVQAFVDARLRGQGGEVELLAIGDWVKGRGCPGDAVVHVGFVAFTSPEGYRYYAWGGGLMKISLHVDDRQVPVPCQVQEWFLAFVRADAFTRQVASVMGDAR